MDNFALLIERYSEKFKEAPTAFFSSPGRTELGGNHTDHQRGRVLASAVELDIIAAVGPGHGTTITIFSEGFDKPFLIDSEDTTPKADEKHSSQALTRGVVASLRSKGFRTGGFNAYLMSREAVGSGLSSSASFEVLVGSILNNLFNKDTIPPLAIAAAGKIAENDYFGKPCGLMDQLTCALGGTHAIDFRNPENPATEPIEFSPHEHGYTLAVVQTGSSHANLTEAYASIPNEMNSVARFFGLKDCRDLQRSDIMNRLNDARRACGDRAVLRALHFLDETERVRQQCDALRRHRFDDFLRLVQQSGDSSMKWLQNSFSVRNPETQPIVLAQLLTDRFLMTVGGGAYRVHGGGFAGTIQVYIPTEHFGKYVDTMSGVFGTVAVTPLAIRSSGAGIVHH